MNSLDGKYISKVKVIIKVIIIKVIIIKIMIINKENMYRRQAASRLAVL